MAGEPFCDPAKDVRHGAVVESGHHSGDGVMAEAGVSAVVEGRAGAAQAGGDLVG